MCALIKMTRFILSTVLLCGRGCYFWPCFFLIQWRAVEPFINGETIFKLMRAYVLIVAVDFLSVWIKAYPIIQGTGVGSMGNLWA